VRPIILTTRAFIQWRPYTLLVNARLSFIAVDVWYRRLPNNTAVLTIDFNIALHLIPANRFRFTIVKRDRTRL